MSVQAISAALALQGVTPSEKLLLIVLANYADERMECWPSQATLAGNTGLTDRGIRKLLVALVAKGLVKKVGRHGTSGQTSDLITLLLSPPEPRSATRPRGSATPRNHVPPPPEHSSYEPTIEPSVEPSRARALATRDRAALAPEERKRVGLEMAELARTLQGDRSAARRR